VTTFGLTAPRPEPSSSDTFEQDHPWDRNFFLAWVLFIWAGVLTGFVPEVIQHVVKHQRPFPPIIHIHGVVFVGWLALLTAQVLLIRTGRWQTHQRLGVLGAILATMMIVVGPMTAVVMDRLEFGTPDDNTPFLFVQMTDMAAFGVLAGSGLALRGRPAAHKRLMLLATLYISDAGFSRFLADPITHQLGRSYWPYFAGLYLGSDLLIIGVGAYDLITRRRLHPAYVGAVIGIVAIQMVSVHFRWDPAWKVMATHLLGH
jgi:hypothetical protein